jgi:hypothetical protein
MIEQISTLDSILISIACSDLPVAYRTVMPPTRPAAPWSGIPVTIL